MPCVISVNAEVEFQIKSDLFVIGGSTTHSVVEELRSAPESELETAGSSDHLHKLTLKSHGLKIPSKVPHRFRDVWEASREHGVGVRLSRMKQQIHNKRCIHMNVQIPLVRLNGPDSSQPYGRLKLSTPELRGHLNLTNDQKEKSTIPASMSFCLIMWACLTCGQSLEQHWKKEVMLSQLPAMQSKVNGEKRWSPVLRPVVQQIDIDRCDQEKWPAVSLYSNELLI